MPDKPIERLKKWKDTPVKNFIKTVGTTRLVQVLPALSSLEASKVPALQAPSQDPIHRLFLFQVHFGNLAVTQK
jgi:hypothetical protein